jgi:hypothetical protein
MCPMDALMLSPKHWKEALRHAWRAHFEGRRYAGSGKLIREIQIVRPGAEFLVTFKDGSQQKILVGDKQA